MVAAVVSKATELRYNGGAAAAINSEHLTSFSPAHCRSSHGIDSVITINTATNVTTPDTEVPNTFVTHAPSCSFKHLRI